MKQLLTKVCGLTRAEDVLLCHQLGIDFTGMIFVEKSPRYLPSSKAADLPVGTARRVGVFAKAEVSKINEIAKKAKLDLIQLHGDESPEFCAQIGAERVIKVLWPERHSPEAFVAEMEKFAPVCAYFLFDAGKSGGGSGRPLLWENLQSLNAPRPWLLAGGVGPENIADALKVCRPAGLDMNSALEDAPGVKNHDRIRQALTLIENFSQSMENPT